MIEDRSGEKKKKHILLKVNEYSLSTRMWKLKKTFNSKCLN